MTVREFGRGWLLLCAAALSVQAQATSPTGATPEPRAARGLERGHVLAAVDITADTLDGRETRFVGWVTRRVIRTGEPLRAPAIAPPLLVRAGTSVTVQFVSSGLSVARAGTALANGALGDPVHIRLDEQRSLSGVVTGPSTVRIP